MPRKSKTIAVTPERVLGRYEIDPKADWGGFINIKITESEKADFEVWWAAHRTECWQALDDLMGQGMKVSFAYDHENECYTCSFTGKGWETCTSRWCMTTRAGELEEVIALSLWKHFELADGDWGDLVPKTGRKAAWG